MLELDVQQQSMEMFDEILESILIRSLKPLVGLVDYMSY